MNAIKDYLISVAAVSMIAGIVIGITRKSGTISAIIKLLSGLFVSVTVLYPLVDVRLSGAQYYFEQLSIDAADAAGVGLFAAENEMRELITERCNAYISEKAQTLGANIEVTVYLDELVPSSVRISGAVSPHVKQQLSNYIMSNLGISLEDQQWTG